MLMSLSIWDILIASGIEVETIRRSICSILIAQEIEVDTIRRLLLSIDESFVKGLGQTQFSRALWLTSLTF